MNIFYLDDCPEIAASMHLWPNHTVKMIIEYAQLLSTAHRLLDGHPYDDLSKTGRIIKRWRLDDEEMEEYTYQVTHRNHMCTKWVMSSWRHYAYLYELMMALGEEFERLTLKKQPNKQHHTIFTCGELLAELPKNIPNAYWQDPPQCMPDEFKRETAIEGYLAYYEHKKEIMPKATVNREIVKGEAQ